MSRERRGRGGWTKQLTFWPNLLFSHSDSIWIEEIRIVGPKKKEEIRIYFADVLVSDCRAF